MFPQGGTIRGTYILEICGCSHTQEYVEIVRDILSNEVSGITSSLFHVMFQKFHFETSPGGDSWILNQVVPNPSIVLSKKSFCILPSSSRERDGITQVNQGYVCPTADEGM